MTPIIEISASNKEVMRIENDGRIFYRHKGKMVQVKMPKDLALAFAVSIEAISGLPHKKLMKKIREEAVEEYKHGAN